MTAKTKEKAQVESDRSEIEVLGEECKTMERMPEPIRFRYSDCKIRWQVFLPLLALHMGALLAPFFFSWSAVCVALILWPITLMLGIGAGYHRQFAHRAFETSRAIKLFHAVCASLAWQQGPLSWVRIHRAHHANSDTDSDPHPQHFGVFFGHVGWAFLAHKSVGRSNQLRKVPQDLANDSILRLMERYHLAICIASFAVLYLAGGIPWLLWGGCVRTVFTMHVTWAVNSVTHRLGYRSFESHDTSTNYLWVALCTFGEGWHNNHHRFPQSSRQGLKYSEIDLTWIWILLLARVGLAWNFRIADPNSGKITVLYPRKFELSPRNE